MKSSASEPGLIFVIKGVSGGPARQGDVPGCSGPVPGFTDTPIKQSLMVSQKNA